MMHRTLLRLSSWGRVGNVVGPYAAARTLYNLQ